MQIIKIGNQNLFINKRFISTKLDMLHCLIILKWHLEKKNHKPNKNKNQTKCKTRPFIIRNSTEILEVVFLETKKIDKDQKKNNDQNR